MDPPHHHHEVNVKITCYLPDLPALHPYLNHSCHPMEAMGDGMDPIPGQTLQSKRQWEVKRSPIYQGQPWHLAMHTYIILFTRPAFCSFTAAWNPTQAKGGSMEAQVIVAEIEITKFLLFLTILNSQLWVMKTSPAEERKSFLHGFVLSCKDAIIKLPQTKSCHAPGGQWSVTIESSWKHLRI